MVLLPTFVFMQWWAFENVSDHREETLNEDENLNLTLHPTIA